ncbi:MAG: DUF1292 domain-containing protein [Lachnospiraceae bacterium]|nr:DUF1292 domain-containing protein [Lachnospiraceae bacterium]
MAENMNCGGSSCEDCTSTTCGFNGSATVTLQLDDGVTQECVVVTIYPAGEHQYIALLPVDENGENEDGEVYIYRFDESNGEPNLENIESDEEYACASEGFDAWLESQEFDDLVYCDEEEEEE